MGLEGSAFLALWNDVETGCEPEYDLWHSREHVPERVGVPGILEGRRYVSPNRSSPAYFTLYNLASLDALASAPYRELVREPTPWSARMRPVFRNFVREPCRIVAAMGMGSGGAIATLRFERDPGTGEISAAAADPMLARLRKHPCIVNAVLGEAAPAEPHPIADTAVECWAGGVRYVLLAEATSSRGLEVVLDAVAATIAAEWGARRPIEARVYDLAFVVRHPGSGPRRGAQRSSTNTG